MNKYQVRRWGAGVIVFILIVLCFGVFGTHSQVELQGDQLGPNTGESKADYLARARLELSEFLGSSDSTYALVSFTYPLDVAAAADAVAGVPRVDAMVVGAASPIVLPEPTHGATRADVFAAEFARINQGLAGIGNVSVPETISALVVHADGDTLREIAGRDGVAGVEPAPADAAWGSFGIRPLAEVDSQFDY